jgi:hypothetical protein
MGNLIRVKQVDQSDFSGFFVQVGSSNYYPLGNPSGYLLQSDLNSATGTINSNINILSGNLNNSINQSLIFGKAYTDTASGTLDSRLVATGSSLSSGINNLSGYVVSVSGNLSSGINSASGTLDTKINTLSGYSTSYTNTVSGNLSSQISAASSASQVNSIVSGDNFHFTGKKFFDSPIYANKINLSGSGSPSSISISSSSGSVSIVGSGGAFVTYSETGSTNSLWSVADAAGLPMIELFDDYTLILGHSSRPSITLSGISGYVLLQNLPNQTQIASLPSGTIYRSGSYLMII